MSSPPGSSRVASPEVVIVGAGPVGLSLALGLARHRVRSVLIEKQETTSRSSKAPAVHVRTLETLRPWGVADRMGREGRLAPSLTLHSAAEGVRPYFSLDFRELEGTVDAPGLLVLEQDRTEEILLDEVQESGMCEVRFGVEAIGVDQDADRVTIRTRSDAGDGSLAAPFAVGCDGASSFVRKALELPFEGFTYALRPMLADVRVDEDHDTLPWPRIRSGSDGLTFAVRLRPGFWRLIRLDQDDPVDETVSDAEVDRRAREVFGAPGEAVVWASRFRMHLRSAPRFRVGRVLLAGDAAHVHSPVGGMGMNAGIQDAGNLAWKLAGALRGGDQDRLLESYHVERRQMVAGEVSRYTDLVTRTFLQSPGWARGGLMRVLGLALRVRPVRRAMAARTMMLDARCPASPILDPAETAAGVRLPNPRLLPPHGDPVRLHDLLPLGPALVEVAGRAHPSEPDGELPVIRIGPEGYRDPSGTLQRFVGRGGGWILVRPDQHVAWARRSPEAMGDAIRHAIGRDGPAPEPG